MRAWIFRDTRQHKKLGDSCPWSVGWLDPEGKRRSKKIGSKSLAEKFARKIEGQLAAGTYEADKRKTWDEFYATFKTRVLDGMKPNTRSETERGLKHFVRIVKPHLMKNITSGTLDDFIAARRLERAGKGDDAPPVSVATINANLRAIRQALRKAVKWGFLPSLPEIGFLREPGKLVTYTAPEEFQKLYAAADAARWPDKQPYPPGDWWRALLLFAYMTGWRIGALLEVRWDDVDLEAGTVLSRWQHNKGKRDQLIPLHPIVIDHLKPLRNFGALVFPWNHGRRRIYDEFKAIRKAAGLPEESGRAFHDLRRGFATMNVDLLPAETLQALMQHRDYATTQRYINIARQLRPVAHRVFVPDLPAVKTAGA